MKLIRFLMIALSIVSGPIKAQELFLKHRQSDAPYYFSLNELWMIAQGPDVESASLEFIGQHGPITSESWSYRFQQDQYSECKTFPCYVPIMHLPMSLESLSCSVRASFKKRSTGTVKISELKWGKCQTPLPRPDIKFLPDLRVNEESTISDLVISNDGYGIVSKKLKIFRYLLDKNEKVIWMSQEDVDLNLSTGGEVTLNLPSILSNWQNELSCTAVMIIDSSHALHERKKKNNEIRIPFGSCEEIPSAEAGDLYDFEPLFSISEGDLTYWVRNSGRLPLLGNYEKGMVQLHYLDRQGNRFVRNLSFGAPLYGFGDTQKVFSESVSEDVCQIEIRINPSFLLKESNYINNIAVINLCE